MRKFVIQARHGERTIYEVECEEILPVEDPSVMWLPEGEYKARITEPEALYEKSPQGSLVPPVWYSHAFYDSLSRAQAVCESNLRYELGAFASSKGRDPAAEEQIQEELAKVKVVMLS